MNRRAFFRVFGGLLGVSLLPKSFFQPKLPIFTNPYLTDSTVWWSYGKPVIHHATYALGFKMSPEMLDDSDFPS